MLNSEVAQCSEYVRKTPNIFQIQHAELYKILGSQLIKQFVAEPVRVVAVETDFQLRPWTIEKATGPVVLLDHQGP